MHNSNEWSDIAILLSRKPYGSKLFVTTVLSKENGKWTALSYDKCVDVGSFVRVDWKGKSPEKLGYFQMDDVHNVFAKIKNNKSKLFAVNSFCTLCSWLAPEREPNSRLFEYSDIFLKGLLSDCSWIKKYIKFELKLLEVSGYGIYFEKCSVTGNPDVFYLSPKTGAAVCEDVGSKYSDKLFRIPSFLKSDFCDDAPLEDVCDAFNIVGYFLKKALLMDGQKNIPFERSLILDDLRKTTQYS